MVAIHSSRKIQSFLWLLVFLPFFLLSACSSIPQNDQYPPQYQAADNLPDTSLWTVIVHGYSLYHYNNNPRVQYYLAYYQAHRDILQIVLNRSVPYLYPIVKQIRDNNMPTELSHESNSQ